MPSKTNSVDEKISRGARMWGMHIAKKQGGKHYQIDTKTDPANAFSDEDLGLKRSETALAAESFLERAHAFINEEGAAGASLPLNATKLRKSDKARRKRERRKVKKGTAKQKRSRRKTSKALARLQKRKAIRRKQEKARKRRARLRGGRSRISVAPKTEE